MFLIRVDWEHYQRNRQKVKITQCRKCPVWGHGTRNCYMLIKYMLCGENHSKNDCPKKTILKMFNMPIVVEIINPTIGIAPLGKTLFLRKLNVSWKIQRAHRLHLLRIFGNSNFISSSIHSYTKNHDAGTHNSNPHIGSSQRPTMEISNSTVKIPLTITSQCSGTFS